MNEDEKKNEEASIRAGVMFLLGLIIAVLHNCG